MPPERSPRSPLRAARLVAGAVAATVLLAGCGASAAEAALARTAPTSGPYGAEATTLRLGYFGNLTHAAAVLGVADGTLQEALGATTLEASVFNAGPAEIEALTGGAIDAGFIGPSPAINSYAKSDGETLRIVAGATANGAALVVAPGIDAVEDLRGTTLATPQFGGTQDIALRTFLRDNGLLVDTTGGDDLSIASQDNGASLDLFRKGDVQGGWLPEPWASRLIVEAGAHELVDETELWDDGRFPTTLLIVSRTFLEQFPGTVAKLLKGHLAALDAIEADPAGAQDRLNAALAELAGKPLADGVLDRAFAAIDPTHDPLADHLAEIAADGVAAGTLRQLPDLAQIVDLRILNRLLVADGRPPVGADGFGQE